ncbi:MAG: P-II family nitrogen regulator [Bacteroidales bacterium]
MKQIQAIIRKTKFEDVKEALVEVGIDWYAYMNVRGVGQDTEERIYRGAVYDTSSIERIMITIVVRDINVRPTVDAILKSARTGEVGDGRVFVSPIDESHSIRTGLQGDKMLYDDNEN